MTDIHLALDDSGRADYPLSSDHGVIAGIARSLQGLRDAGFTAAAGYSGSRLATVDDDPNEDEWDPDCTVGWVYFGNTGDANTEYRVGAAFPQAHSARVAIDIAAFKEAVNREALAVEKILAQEAMSPHTDSGHKWSDDVLHAIAKPNIRLLQLLLAGAKANPSATTIGAYAAQLGLFVAASEDPGLAGIYDDAIKSVWRPLRDGTHAYGYARATDAAKGQTKGGIRQVEDPNNPGSYIDASAPVAYPAGDTVATWDALGAVEAL